MQLALDPARVSAYAALMLVGILVTAWLWDRIGRGGEQSCLRGRGHLGFEINAQAVGDAVDVVEVGRHLDGVVDGAVVEAMGPQLIEIGGRNLRGSARELECEVAQRPVGR